MSWITKDNLLEKENEFLLKLDEEVFIYPTDTIYGLGCDATNHELVHKVREIKKRTVFPFSVIVPNKEWILENCVITEKAKEWIDKLPGSYTLILKLKNKNAVADNVAPDMDSVGVRMINSWFQTIVTNYGKPIVTTAANVVGGNFMSSKEDLDPFIERKVDFIVYDGIAKRNPSTIVHLENDEEIVRER